MSQRREHPPLPRRAPAPRHLAREMRIAYADSPYLGCCGLYGHHHPDGLCWDDVATHAALIERIGRDFDGYVLHAHVPSIPSLAPMQAADIASGAVRICSWVKGFAAYKRNVPVAYAWEPVYIKAARKPVVSGRHVSRDWIECPITLRRGLTGAKPEKVCHWAFELVGARPEDELVDLFPRQRRRYARMGDVAEAVRAACGRSVVRGEDMSRRKPFAGGAG